MSTNFKRVTVVFTGMLFSSLFATVSSGTVVEGFEGFSPNTTPGVPFTVGTAPEEATFSGNAFAGVLGVGALYHSGVRSWMVLENSVGRVDFDANAAQVDFFARTHPSADGDTLVSAFDDSGNAVGAVVTLVQGAGFVPVSFSGSIDYILFDNQATNTMNAVDDFSFTAVPEPSSIAICSMAASAMLIFRRRKCC